MDVWLVTRGRDGSVSDGAEATRSGCDADVCVAMTRLRTAVALFGVTAVLVAGAPGADAQIVRGVVVGVGDGEPIADAALVLRFENGGLAATAVSSAAGEFVLEVPRSGTVRLEVSHLGYADWGTAPFELVSGAIMDVEVRLGVEAIPLDPITVVAESRMALGGLAGFQERATNPTIGGYFIHEEEIARRRMAIPSNLVLAAPGMSVGLASSAAGFERNVIMAGGCVARTYVDGIRVQQGAGASVDDLLTPDRIAGVEMYPRSVGAPLQYTEPGGRGCGVVLFWTKPADLDDDRGRSRSRILLGVGLLVGILTVAFIG